MINGKLLGGLHRVLRKSPVVVAFLCAVILAFVSFYNSNKLQGHHGVTGTQGLRRNYERETVRLSNLARNAKSTERGFNSGIPPSPSSENSVKSLKELVKDAVERGLVVIVNASDADAARVLADHWHGSRLDISGALDGPMGDILVEVVQELRNMEDMAIEVAALKHKIQQFEQEKGNVTLKSKMTLGMSGDHGIRPSGRSLHSLLLFSASRFALDEFTAVGLAAPSLLPNPFPEVEQNSCTWIEWDDFSSSPSATSTNARVQRGEKRTILIHKGDSPYAVVVIKCRFTDPAGSNGYGGHLFINSTADDHVPVLSEPPESIDKIQFEGALPRRFAVCTPPIWKPLNPRVLSQWLMYHHHLLGREKIHYFFYTGIPLDAATLRILKPFRDREMLTLADWTESEMQRLVGGESQFPSALLARNDCVQRSRFFADWAVLWEFNEFLQMLPPTRFLPLVNSHADAPYIAFGNQRWSSAYCISQQNQTTEPWATDRMIFRLELAPCGKNNNDNDTQSSSESQRSASPSDCVGGEGMRRHVVNPRKVYAVHHHFVIDPSWGGAEVSTEKARLNQWIGNFLSTEPDKPTCNIVVKETEAVDPSTAVDGFWYKDASFATASRPAHAWSANSSLFGASHDGR